MLDIARRAGTAASVRERLVEDGAVIVERVVPGDLLDEVLKDLRPAFDAQGLKFTNDFNGYKTRRLGGILGLSRAASGILAHPGSVAR